MSEPQRAVIAARRERFGLVGQAFRTSLVDRVDRDHRESDAAFRRRRIVAVVVLIAGATLLGISLGVSPTSKAFYPLTFGLAVVWAVGGLASGRLHWGYEKGRTRMVRPVLIPFALGVVLAGIFTVGALVVREIPFLDRVIKDVLAHAQYGNLPLVAVITLVNGLAEETFFRGALFAAVGVRHPVLISTLIYTAAMAASGNLMLMFAAITLGFIWGLQRRASGGILASMITHVTWSLIMLFVLPPIFGL
jgi:uncharacterized protein